ncbi:MAG: three-Cys-motif partner protein TcmP, partial [Candidatus Tectomicrobia bacterium]|nr:three-Cys-motif partner protein TcmP [Candidatus Tectomicrobia bacterium]
MEREDTIGAWSLEKLGLVRKYLEAYVLVLRKQSWCRGYEYIDAFAGTGKPKSRDEQKYVDGSPRIALGLSHPFSRYHFIESSNWRIKKLERLKQELPNRHILIHPGDCNAILCNEIVPN